jgi:hypothetical protein
VFVTVSQFEQWADIKFFCILGRSAMEILVSFSAVDRDEARKELLCMAYTTNLKTVKNH